MSLDTLLSDARACTVCTNHLPLGPRPVVKMQSSAQLLIIGQAPGTRVHESGVPWDDKSGARLRAWLHMEPELFYDTGKVAIMPMGFCYPGVNDKGGDKPPRPECAPLWHDALLEQLPHVQLTLLIGQYAQKRYLAAKRGKNLTETVAHYRDYLPTYLPLPHPSWRTVGWQRKNEWFDADVLPALRQRVSALFGS